MAEKRPTPVKPLTIYFYHTRLTRESYEEWKDYKFPGHIWGIERSGFFNGREKWAKGFENQRV